MSADRRAALAAAQHDLLAALVTSATPPPGFDARQIEVQARALLAKRARTAAAHHSWLSAALGPDYLAHFTDYAHGHPKPVGSSTHSDALDFEAFLRDAGRLPSRPDGREPRLRGGLRRIGRAVTGRVN